MRVIEDGPAFCRSEMDWLRWQNFANERLGSAEWALMPLVLLPKNDSQQEGLMQAEYPEYETPGTQAALFAVIAEFLQTCSRTWPNEYGRCQNNSIFGDFDAIGLNADLHVASRKIFMVVTTLKPGAKIAGSAIRYYRIPMMFGSFRKYYLR